jgi:hypothetical protein
MTQIHMTHMNTLVERNHLAGLLAVQCLLRMSGLLGIGALSALRRMLDTYLLCLQHSAHSINQSRLTDSPTDWAADCVDTTTECIEKSWQDFRNSIQILLLTQDEALIWIARIDKALLGK